MLFGGQELTRFGYKLPEHSICSSSDADVAALLDRTGGATGGAVGIGWPDGAGKGEVRVGTEALGIIMIGSAARAGTSRERIYLLTVLAIPEWPFGPFSNF